MNVLSTYASKKIYLSSNIKEFKQFSKNRMDMDLDKLFNKIWLVYFT